MKKSSEFRAAGLADLNGKWKQAILFTLVYIVIAMLLGGTLGILRIGDVGTFLVVLALYPMSWSVYTAFLNNQRGDEEALSISRLFIGYTDFRIFTTMLLQFVYTFLWSLLLLVPGIIKGLSYSMTYFILLDNPEMSNNAAIEESMRMMDGHKWQFFKLYLSFIGWAILCIFTLGIGILWLNPYIYSTMARFYTELKDPQVQMTDNYVK